MKSLQIILPAMSTVAALSCNQFPPISGDQADEANDVVYALHDFLKTQPSSKSIQVFGRGGNYFLSIFVYGARSSQAQQGVIEATRKYVNEHPLRKDVHLKFYDLKYTDGKDGTLLNSCVIPKYKGPWPR